jgi:hypothetical protein
MTAISLPNGAIVLINVFTVDPANQERLIKVLAEATEVAVRRAPGFVSTTLHRSLDGSRVTRALAGHRAPPSDASGSGAARVSSGSAHDRLNPASKRSCEPSHPPASRIEATTVLSALRQKGGRSQEVSF